VPSKTHSAAPAKASSKVKMIGIGLTSINSRQEGIGRRAAERWNMQLVSP
jgi:hypothetical protein